MMDSLEISLVYSLHSLSILAETCLDMELLPKFCESWQGTVRCTIYVSVQLFYWVHNWEIQNKW